MLKVQFTTRFKKDFKAIKTQADKAKKLQEIVQKLANQEKLPERNQDHALSGEYKEFRECHILPDFLLIYEIKEKELILLLLRVGSHSDLF